MIKRYYFTLIFIFCALPCLSCHAEGDDWGEFVSSYDKNVINKPVTDAEFNQAIQTIQSRQKKKNKNNTKTDIKNNEPMTLDINDKLPNKEPLLRLPTNATYDDYLIQSGIYICEIIENNNNMHYLLLKQADKIYAVIKLIELQDKSEFINETVSVELAESLIIIKVSKAGSIYEANLSRLK